MRMLCLLAILLAPIQASAQTPSAKTLTVFAAASLTNTLNEIAALWTKDGHPAPHMSYAASSTLARQIQEGAPANIFASADEKWMDYLAKANLIVPSTRKDLLGNDLVLIVPSTNPIHLTITPKTNLLALLGANGRLAVGDPAYVPAGIYAEQALKHLGMWASIQPHLASTADVRAALLLVERDEAPAGIVYGTDAAVSKAVRIAGTFPADSHPPITYPFAVIKAGNTPQAQAFLNFLATKPAQAIFARAGFKTK